MILVTTPTGNSGSHIIRQLLHSGQSIKVLARDASKLPNAIRTQVQVAEGSLLEVNQFAAALAGCDMLYYCIPQSTHPTDLMKYYEEFAQVAVQAMKQSDVQRVVYLSGAGKASGVMTAGTASALFLGEDILLDSGIALRALRCPVFFDNLFWQIPTIHYTSSWALPIAGDYQLAQVAVTDIASAAVRWLTDTSWGGVAGVGVLGPANISHDQIAEAVSAALGKTVWFREVGREEHVANLVRYDLSPVLAEGVADMFAAIAAGLFDAEPRTPESTTPTTIDQWLATDFLPVYQAQTQAILGGTAGW